LFQGLSALLSRLSHGFLGHGRVLHDTQISVKRTFCGWRVHLWS
jgi:hypothetical protein